jgi:hypothetical protein
LPELEKIRQEFEPQGVGFLALSLSSDRETVRTEAGRLGIRMAVGTTPAEVLAPLGVNAVPATLFVDRDGTIVAAATGEKSLRSLRAQAAKLLP